MASDAAARDAQFEQFDQQHPVGGAAIKSIYFAGNAINTGLIKPTDEIIELTKKFIESEHPLEDAKRILSAAGNYVDQVMKPGDQRVTNRDPVGHSAEMASQQYAKFKNSPTLDRYAQLGAMTGVAVGGVIDPTHGEAKVLKGLSALDDMPHPSHVNAPHVYSAEMVNEALEAAAAVKAAKKQIEHAYEVALKRDNPFKEALDRSDGTHMDMSLGMTIAERTVFKDWNRNQVGTRAEFYDKVFIERPDLALAMQKQDPSMQGVRELITSTHNDHLIGIESYNNRSSHVVYAEQQVRKSVDAAKKLDTELHIDATLRLLDPNRPMDPKLEAQVSQLLHVKLEGHTLSTESRKLLPPELRHLPVKEIEKLQEQAAHLVPENLRLSAGHQQGALPSNAASNSAGNVAAIDTSVHKDLSAHASPSAQQMQQLKQDFLNSLSTVSKGADHNTVATVVPPSPKQVAAQARYDSMLNNPEVSPLKKAGQVVTDTIASESGAGYNMGPLKQRYLEKQASASDYDALVTTVKNGAGLAAKTATVAGATVAFGAAGTAAYFGMQLAKNVVRHYDLGDKINDLAKPVFGPLKDATLTLNYKIKMATEQVKAMVVPEVMDQAEMQRAAQNYLKLMAELPKTRDGMHFTAQSQAVLDSVGKTIEASATVVHDAALHR